MLVSVGNYLVLQINFISLERGRFVWAGCFWCLLRSLFVRQVAPYQKLAMKHGMGVKSIGGLLFIRMVLTGKSQGGLLCNYLEGVPQRRMRFTKGSVVVGSRTGECCCQVAECRGHELERAAGKRQDGKLWTVGELRREGWSVSCQGLGLG